MRMSTDDIVKKGDYLLASFNPASLTTDQLTGLLQRHEIRVPGRCKKSKLIELFNSKIKAVEIQRVIDSQATEAPTRQVSRNFGTNTEDSGWEDNNVFQQNVNWNGASPSTQRTSQNSDASSSIRAPPVNGRRFSTQVSHSQSLFKSPTSSVQSVESPVLPQPNVRAPVFSVQRPGVLPKRKSFYIWGQNYSTRFLPREDESDGSPRFNSSAATPFTRLHRHRNGVLGKQRRISVFRRILLFGFVLVLIGCLFQYKSKSSSIGFCDRGSRDNGKLAELRKKRLELEICREKQEQDEEIICPLSFSLFDPAECTMCPGHADCDLENVNCDDGYGLIRHPLSLVPFLSEMCDGLPGIGPVAFPSRCIEDPVRKRSIDDLAKGIKSLLAIERGRRICMNEIPEISIEGGDALKWGLEIKRLKDDMKRKASPQKTDNFDILFGEAVQQLLEYGHVIKGEDFEGQSFLATEHVYISWKCLIVAFVRNTWKEWRSLIIGVLTLSFSTIYGCNQVTAKRYERKRVSELVHLAFDSLRNQELSHRTDPTASPAAYISSLQLRDSILEEEHSIVVRTRLWAQVEKVVEGNANVRVNMEELPGGDELRVWRWVGAAGRPRQILSNTDGNK